MCWAQSPGTPPSLGRLANGYNLILIEPLHGKPVQGLVGTAGKDRWSERPTFTSKGSLLPKPCSLDLRGLQPSCPEKPSGKDCISPSSALQFSTGGAVEPGGLGAHLKSTSYLDCILEQVIYLSFLNLTFLSCPMMP